MPYQAKSYDHIAQARDQEECYETKSKKISYFGQDKNESPWEKLQEQKIRSSQERKNPELLLLLL